MSEMSDFTKFELQVSILCNLKIFACWSSDALHKGPSARLAKLIRSPLIEFKLRKNLIYDVNGILMQILPQVAVWFRNSNCKFLQLTITLNYIASMCCKLSPSRHMGNVSVM